MFTVEQITQAHSHVKSGADFPKYIQDIKNGQPNNPRKTKNVLKYVIRIGIFIEYFEKGETS